MPAVRLLASLRALGACVLPLLIPRDGGGPPEFRESQVAPRPTREVMRIRSDERDSRLLLTAVTDLVVSQSGNIYSAHESESVVRIFAPDGSLAGAFGRQGQGPGEWSGAFDLLGTVGDSILVRDQNSWDVDFFNDAGRYLRTRAARSSTRRVIGYLGQDHVVSEERFRSRSSGASPAAVEDSTVFVVLDGQGNSVRRVYADTVGRPPNVTVRFPPVGDEIPAFAYVTQQPFAASYLLSEDPTSRRCVLLLPHSAWGGAPGQVRLLLVSATGVSQRILQLEARPLRTADVGRWVQMEADRLDQLARKHAVPRRDIEEQLRNAVQQPAYWAPVRRALVGRDGSLWILPSWETERWSVFLDGPTPSFFVDAPDSAVVMHVSTREMWAVFSDSLGRPSIVKYEIANR